MVQRSISVKDIEEGIKQGSRVLQKPNKLMFQYQYFTVITKKIGKDYFVITVKPRW